METQAPTAEGLGGRQLSVLHRWAWLPSPPVESSLETHAYKDGELKQLVPKGDVMRVMEEEANIRGRVKKRETKRIRGVEKREAARWKNSNEGTETLM